MVPWDELKDDLRPFNTDPQAWDVVFTNLKANVGPTWGSMVQMFSDNAQYLARLGQRVIDVAKLWSFEVDQAIGISPIRTVASAIDAAVTTAGADLSFGRTFPVSLENRFDTSLFGRGWQVPWDTQLAVDDDGTVSIFNGSGARRRFQPDSRYVGVYVGSAADSGMLVPIGGNGYELREQDGSVTRFGPSGHLEFVQDPNGNRITVSHGPGGRVTGLVHSAGGSLTIAYNAGGVISSITDSMGRVTGYTYDATNQYLLSVTAPDGQVTSYTYETSAAASMHALRTVTTGGVTKNFEYDALGHLKATDINGSTSRIEFASGSAGQVTTTDAGGGTSTLWFDHRGLLGKVTDPFGRITTLQYGEDMRLSRIVDPVGQSQAFTWCSCGSMTSSTDQSGKTTRFTYDYVGPSKTVRRMTSFTDANGRTTRYTYDAKGNLLQTIYPNGSIERVTGYDPMGDPLAFINRRGQTLSYAYNSRGQVTRQTFADNTFIDFAYDSRGNLKTVTEPGAKSTTFDYDAGDRLTKVTYPQGRFLSFTYDAAGRRSTMTDQTGYVVRYFYDAAGRLAALRDTAGDLIVHYSYDDAGRLARKDNGNATYTIYTYDVAGQILSIANHAPNGSINSSFSYVYDALGRRTQQMTIDGTWMYGYDATGQLTTAVFTPVLGSPVPAQDLRYIYDAVGNRIRTIENGVVTEYTTNNLNQYTKVGDDTLVYDADGNLISRAGPGGNATYAYDQQNRLTRVATAEGVWEYEYDAFGNQVSRLTGGDRTEYAFDPIGLVNLVGQYDAAGSIRTRYVHAVGLVMESASDATRTFVEFDAIGSVVGLTSGSGTGLGQISFSPTGTVLANSSARSEGFLFAGRFGALSGPGDVLVMRARCYSVDLSRFIQSDPTGLAGDDANFYRYASNNPVTYIDPTGMKSVSLGGEMYYGFGGGGSIILNDNGQKCVSVEAGLGSGGGVGLSSGENAETGVELFAEWSFSAGPISITFGWSSSKSGFTFVAGGFGTDLEDRSQLRQKPSAHGWYGLQIKTGIRGTLCDTDLTKPPPKPPGDEGDQDRCQVRNPVDPNELTGPAGYGDQHFVAPDAVLPYRIEFENYGPGSKDQDGNPVSPDRWATAPAQRVDITNPLPIGLDPSTLVLTGFGFGDFNIRIGGSLQHHQQVLTTSINGTTIQVWFEAALDIASRTLRISFQSLDPETLLPPDVLVGFLPPEDGTGRGRGFATYSARPVASLSTGTEIRNIAHISFDGQLLIATNQVDPLDPSKGADPNREALVTIDSGNPTSMVDPLPPSIATRSFPVSWSGQDDAGGSGVSAYDVYVSTDGGVYKRWLNSTAATSATFEGDYGHTYRFYSRGIDNVGLVESAPEQHDAITTVVDVSPTLSSIVINDGAGQRSMVTSMTVTFSRAMTLGSGAISLQGPSGNYGISVVPLGTYADSYRITFAGASIIGGSLADGRFELKLVASLIKDSLGRQLLGGTVTQKFHRLFADLDGDADVDSYDLAVFRNGLESHAGDDRYRWFQDYDGDGDIDVSDWEQARSRLGKKLPPSVGDSGGSGVNDRVDPGQKGPQKK
ncbi:MAG: hypothetical protein L6Q35_12845 [Phycisphaerales bacterium]|nr:hypothetical protein [Phycisphaerales bacterium]